MFLSFFPRRTIMLTRRREFLVAGAVLGISGIAIGADQPAAGEDVSAIEDLMREHGVLRRILLIYEECLRRIRANNAASNGPLMQSCAVLLRRFVEDYHEKLEENYLFPEFEKRNQLVPLVKVLRQQHVAGRALTDVISRQLEINPKNRASLPEVTAACESFIRMYRPHAAREDTVLFTALRKILSAKQLDELGDKFEDEENRRFGAGGFEKVVQQVAAAEKALGIYDLAQFTPKT
jgi:hemerythrin-like domain-containing protein